jgi:hypothetical protein
MGGATGSIYFADWFDGERMLSGLIFVRAGHWEESYRGGGCICQIEFA